MAAPIPIVHYSDALCVWAFVSQARMDELLTRQHDKVRLSWRCCNVYGDAWTKVHRGWDERGGFSAYAQHVKDVVARFGHVSVHPDVWARCQPRSSLPAHHFVAAVAVLQDDGTVDAGIDPVTGLDAVGRALRTLRQAFFTEAIDISSRRHLLELAQRCALPCAAIEARLDDGSAAARCMADFDQASADHIVMSPTLVLDGGRQKLQGNVGYRVIEANVAELLHAPTGASWC